MGYVDEAFTKLRHTLEISKTEQDQGKRRHEAVRDYLGQRWDLTTDFLTGSYVRDTKTKKLKDVDVFVVVAPDGAQGHLQGASPNTVLGALLAVIEPAYPGSFTDDMAVVIPFGKEEEIMSLEIVPAFERSGGGYEIPDERTGGWIATDPRLHHDLSIAKNKACDGKFVPFVKMVKGINRHLDEPARSFLLEVMAHGIVEEPFTDYPDEIRWFLATAVDEIHSSWPDPAGLGPDVNTLSSAQRQQAASVFSAALATAELAIDQASSGQERAAVESWRELFGWRMPRP